MAKLLMIFGLFCLIFGIFLMSKNSHQSEPENAQNLAPNTNNFYVLHEEKPRQKRFLESVVALLIMSNILSVFAGSLANDLIMSVFWMKLVYCFRVISHRNFVSGYKLCWLYANRSNQKWRKLLKPHNMEGILRIMASNLRQQSDVGYHEAMLAIQQQFEHLVLDGDVFMNLLGMLNNAGLELPGLFKKSQTNDGKSLIDGHKMWKDIDGPEKDLLVAYCEILQLLQRDYSTLFGNIQLQYSQLHSTIVNIQKQEEENNIEEQELEIDANLPILCEKFAFCLSKFVLDETYGKFGGEHPKLSKFRAEPQKWAVQNAREIAQKIGLKDEHRVTLIRELTKKYANKLGQLKDKRNDINIDEILQKSQNQNVSKQGFIQKFLTKNGFFTKKTKSSQHSGTSQNSDDACDCVRNIIEELDPDIGDIQRNEQGMLYIDMHNIGQWLDLLEPKEQKFLEKMYRAIERDYFGWWEIQQNWWTRKRTISRSDSESTKMESTVDNETAGTVTRRNSSNRITTVQRTSPSKRSDTRLENTLSGEKGDNSSGKVEKMEKDGTKLKKIQDSNTVPRNQKDKQIVQEPNDKQYTKEDDTIDPKLLDTIGQDQDILLVHAKLATLGYILSKDLLEHRTQIEKLVYFKSATVPQFDESLPLKNRELARQLLDMALPSATENFETDNSRVQMLAEEMESILDRMRQKQTKIDTVQIMESMFRDSDSQAADDEVVIPETRLNKKMLDNLLEKIKTAENKKSNTDKDDHHHHDEGFIDERIFESVFLPPSINLRSSTTHQHKRAKSDGIVVDSVVDDGGASASKIQVNKQQVARSESAGNVERHDNRSVKFESKTSDFSAVRSAFGSNLRNRRRRKRFFPIETLLQGFGLSLLTGFLGNWISEIVDLSLTAKRCVKNLAIFRFKTCVVWTKPLRRNLRNKHLLNFINKIFLTLFVKMAEVKGGVYQLSDMLKEVEAFLRKSIESEGTDTKGLSLENYLVDLDLFGYSSVHYQVDQHIQGKTKVHSKVNILNAMHQMEYMTESQRDRERKWILKHMTAEERKEYWDEMEQNNKITKIKSRNAEFLQHIEDFNTLEKLRSGEKKKMLSAEHKIRELERTDGFSSKIKPLEEVFDDPQKQIDEIQQKIHENEQEIAWKMAENEKLRKLKELYKKMMEAKKVKDKANKQLDQMREAEKKNASEIMLFTDEEKEDMELLAHRQQLAHETESLLHELDAKFGKNNAKNVPFSDFRSAHIRFRKIVLLTIMLGYVPQEVKDDASNEEGSSSSSAADRSLSRRNSSSNSPTKTSGQVLTLDNNGTDKATRRHSKSAKTGKKKPCLVRRVLAFLSPRRLNRIVTRMVEWGCCSDNSHERVEDDEDFERVLKQRVGNTLKLYEKTKRRWPDNGDTVDKESVTVVEKEVGERILGMAREVTGDWIKETKQQNTESETKLQNDQSGTKRQNDESGTKRQNDQNMSKSKIDQTGPNDQNEIKRQNDQNVTKSKIDQSASKRQMVENEVENQKMEDNVFYGQMDEIWRQIQQDKEKMISRVYG